MLFVSELFLLTGRSDPDASHECCFLIYSVLFVSELFLLTGRNDQKTILKLMYCKKIYLYKVLTPNMKALTPNLSQKDGKEQDMFLYLKGKCHE